MICKVCGGGEMENMIESLSGSVYSGAVIGNDKWFRCNRCKTEYCDNVLGSGFYNNNRKIKIINYKKGAREQ